MSVTKLALSSGVLLIQLYNCKKHLISDRVPQCYVPVMTLCQLCEDIGKHIMLAVLLLMIALHGVTLLS